MAANETRSARVLGAALRYMLSEEDGLSAGQPVALLPADPWEVDELLVTKAERRAALNLAEQLQFLRIERTMGFPAPVEWLPNGRVCAEQCDGDVYRFRATYQQAGGTTINTGDNCNIAFGSYITQNQMTSESQRTPSWSLERPNPRKDTVVLANNGDGPAHDVDIERPPTPIFRGDTHYDRVDPGQKISLALRFTGQTRLADRALSLTYRSSPGGERKTWKTSVPS